MYQENKQQIEQELIKSLSARIEKEVTSEGHKIWGHGTSVNEIAEKILVEGIAASPSFTLLEQAYPLTDHSKSPQENADLIMKAALDWKHNQRKNIVLISIPHSINSKEELVEYVQIDGRERMRIPTRFIKGYIDALNMSFVPNPRYEHDAAPTERFKFPTGLPRPRPHTEPHAPTAHDIPPKKTSDSSDDDIW